MTMLALRSKRIWRESLCHQGERFKEGARLESARREREGWYHKQEGKVRHDCSIGRRRGEKITGMMFGYRKLGSDQENVVSKSSPLIHQRVDRTLMTVVTGLPALISELPHLSFLCGDCEERKHPSGSRSRLIGKWSILM